MEGEVYFSFRGTRYLLTGRMIKIGDAFSDGSTCEISGNILGNCYIPSQKIHVHQTHNRHSPHNKSTYPTSGMGQTSSIFTMIKRYLVMKDWDAAYETIMKLRFIKKPLLKDLFESEAGDMIKKIYQVPLFSNIIDMVPGLILDEFPVILEPFFPLKDDDAAKILQASIEIPETKILRQLLNKDSTPFTEEFEKKYIPKFIELCAISPRLEQLDLLLSRYEGVLTEEFLLKILNQQHDINTYVHLIHLLRNKYVSKPNQVQFLRDGFNKFFVKEPFPRMNCDSWVKYCNITNTLLSNQPSHILQKIKYSIDTKDRDEETIIFRSSKALRRHPKTLEFKSIEKQIYQNFHKIENTETDFLDQILSDDELDLYEAMEDFSVN